MLLIEIILAVQAVTLLVIAWQQRYYAQQGTRKWSKKR